jgi:hypothetical protein
MKNVYPDVLKYTPKENADLIEKISKRGLWIDQNVLFWLIFMLEDSQYGFFQFLPKRCRKAPGLGRGDIRHVLV